MSAAIVAAAAHQNLSWLARRHIVPGFVHDAHIGVKERLAGGARLRDRVLRTDQASGTAGLGQSVDLVNLDPQLVVVLDVIKGAREVLGDRGAQVPLAQQHVAWDTFVGVALP